MLKDVITNEKDIQAFASLDPPIKASIEKGGYSSVVDGGEAKVIEGGAIGMVKEIRWKFEDANFVASEEKEP